MNFFVNLFSLSAWLINERFNTEAQRHRESQGKIFICIFFFSLSALFPQEKINFQSPPNIKKFADHLFCEKDFLRAAFEYENYLSITSDDSIKFKLGLAYQRLGEYKKSSEVFYSILPGDKPQSEYFNSLFHTEDYQNFRRIFLDSPEKVKTNLSARKLYLFSHFFTDDMLPSANQFLDAFQNHKNEIQNFYNRKNYPSYKSEITAAILSALIPGAGKVYTEEYGDAITSFFATGVLTYLSYSNFNAGHNFRGWLFAGAASIFYAGNIYGSAASANIFNAGVKLNFENDLKFFLNENNYFMPDYNFCK